MRFITLSFGFVLFLAGCGPDAKEINAFTQKVHDCVQKSDKKYIAETKNCQDRFGLGSFNYEKCREAASDVNSQETVNCGKLPENW